MFLQFCQDIAQLLTEEADFAISEQLMCVW
jgi:hypothetical protein